jgi:[ribosomal protein S18]-alanine N-acetyltransferase
MSFLSQPLPDTMSSVGFARMEISDLKEVQVVEDAVYPFPWTAGNFIDSLRSGYDAWVARDADGKLIGYFLIMFAVDEAHLLNITVRGDLHGCGFGRLLLDRTMQIARDNTMTSVLLEVRPSNQRALHVYRRYGFTEIGRRKGYYPASGKTREDAIVMRMAL